MPAYNAEATIGDAVQSIFNQTCKPEEFLIINDGSTDNTLRIINDMFPLCPVEINLRVINQKRSGLAKTLIRLVELSTNDIIARMDADDISVKSRLEIQLKHMEASNLDIVGSNIELCGSESGVRPYPETRNEINFCLPHRCAFAHPSILAKRQFLDYEDEEKEDYKLWLRLLQKQPNWENIQLPLLKYRVTPTQISNVSRQNDDGFKGHRYLRERRIKNIDTKPTFAAIRFIAKSWIKEKIAKFSNAKRPKKNEVVLIGAGVAGSTILTHLLKSFEITVIVSDETFPVNSIGYKMKLAQSIKAGLGGTSKLWHNALIQIDEKRLEQNWLSVITCTCATLLTHM